MTTTKNERIAAIKQAVERGGGIVRFSKGLGVTHQAVYSWMQRGWVPPERAVAIEAVFNIDRNLLMNPDLVALLASPAADA